MGPYLHPCLSFLTSTAPYDHAPCQSHPPAGTQMGVAMVGCFWGGNPSFWQPSAPHAMQCRQPSQTRIPDIFFSFLCSQEIHISWEVKVSPGSS